MSIIMNISKSVCCVRSRAAANNGTLSLIFVRWRKPRWLPKAPSKIFRVRKPTVLDPAEAEFLKKHQFNYQTDIKTIRRFLVEYELDRRRKMSGEGQKLKDESEWQTMVEKNNVWNFEVGLQREKYMAALEEKQALIKEKIKERDEREKRELLIAAEKKVQETKEKVGSFITRNNLDSEIDKMLNTRSDYDFALKPDGTTTKDIEDPTNTVDKTSR